MNHCHHSSSLAQVKAWLKVPLKHSYCSVIDIWLDWIFSLWKERGERERAVPSKVAPSIRPHILFSLSSFLVILQLTQKQGTLSSLFALDSWHSRDRTHMYIAKHTKGKGPSEQYKLRLLEHKTRTDDRQFIASFSLFFFLRNSSIDQGQMCHCTAVKSKAMNGKCAPDLPLVFHFTLFWVHFFLPLWLVSHFCVCQLALSQSQVKSS